MRINFYFNKTSINLLHKPFKSESLKLIGYVILTLIICGFFSLAFGADELAGILPDVKDTFGPGSTGIKLIYALEALSAIYFYHKNKNLAVFAGIPAIAIISTYLLNHYVFS